MVNELRASAKSYYRHARKERKRSAEGKEHARIARKSFRITRKYGLAEDNPQRKARMRAEGLENKARGLYQLSLTEARRQAVVNEFMQHVR